MGYQVYEIGWFEDGPADESIWRMLNRGSYASIIASGVGHLADGGPPLEVYIDDERIPFEEFRSRYA